MDERYFMNNRKASLTSMEDIKKRMLERYPIKPSEATPESHDGSKPIEPSEFKLTPKSYYGVGLSGVEYGRNSCYPSTQNEVEKRYAKELTETNIKNFGMLMPSKAIPIRPNSDLLNSVISDLEARELCGISKYGTTMDRNDLGLKAWLEHLYHELLDAALYTKKQITLLDQNDKAAND